ARAHPIGELAEPQVEARGLDLVGIERVGRLDGAALDERADHMVRQDASLVDTESERHGPSSWIVYPIARLTGRFQPRKRHLSRGHLSRQACSHVKQVAKRPGTRGPGGMISGRVFCWAKEALMSASQSRQYRPETSLVHSGSLRSQFGETSEALFLTQGYVYDSSLTAERRFKNEDPGYQSSRFSNPTVTMFEQRMAALEGAQAARATATGMAAVTTAVMGQLRAGDHVVASKALFG